MMLGTPRSNNNNKRSFFEWVDSFRMEMQGLEAIFRYFQKTLHNFFKNWTYQVFSKIEHIKSDCLCLNLWNTRYSDMKRCKWKIK
jgi:hypothetical protein